MPASQPHAKQHNVARIAEAIGGTVEGDATIAITGIAGLRAAQPGEITFLADKKHLRALPHTRAAAIIIPAALDLPDGPRPAATIRVQNIETAIAAVARLFSPPDSERRPGVHPAAVVSPAATLGEDVSIGAGAVIEDDAQIGDHATIGPLVYIGRGVTIGAHTRIHPGVRITHGCTIGSHVTLHPGVAIGGDGFGYTFQIDHHEKIPQLGIVAIADHVEIGSNTTVDRARFGATRIGRGTKIDNLVMIAHNVQIGDHCIITAEVGIAGSTVIGDYVMIGAQAGIVGHIVIGDRVKIAAGAGVTKDIPPDSEYFGAPAEPRDKAVRELMAVRRLPELADEFRKVRRKLTDLYRKLGIDEETPAND